MKDDLIAKLWACNNSDNEYTITTWLSIIRNLTTELESFFECKIKPDGNPAVCADPASPSFCSEIDMLFSKQGPLTLHAKGILGMQLVEGDNGGDDICVDIYIFLYGNDEILLTTNDKHFIRCVYKQVNDQEGKWGYVGWFEDEWGEFC